MYWGDEEEVDEKRVGLNAALVQELEFLTPRKLLYEISNSDKAVWAKLKADIILYYETLIKLLSDFERTNLAEQLQCAAGKEPEVRKHLAGYIQSNKATLAEFISTGKIRQI